MPKMAKEDYTLSYEYAKINSRRSIVFALIEDLELIAGKIRGSKSDKNEIAGEVNNLIEMLRLSVKMGKF